jgi:hypothetical protein
MDHDSISSGHTKSKDATPTTPPYYFLFPTLFLILLAFVSHCVLLFRCPSPSHQEGACCVVSLELSLTCDWQEIAARNSMRASP